MPWWWPFKKKKETEPVPQHNMGDLAAKKQDSVQSTQQPVQKTPIGGGAPNPTQPSTEKVPSTEELLRQDKELERLSIEAGIIPLPTDKPKKKKRGKKKTSKKKSKKKSTKKKTKKKSTKKKR